MRSKKVQPQLWAFFASSIMALLHTTPLAADEFSALQLTEDDCGKEMRVVDEEQCGTLLCFCGDAPDGPKSFKGTAKDKAGCQKICGTEAMSSYPLETPTTGGEYSDNCQKLDHDPLLSKGAPADFKCPEGCRPVRTGPIGLYQGYGSGCCLVKSIWNCKKRRVFSRPSEVIPQ